MMPMDVPTGTELHLILETPVSSETAKPEQTVRARVSKPVVISGMTVIPEGAPVRGTVVAAERSGRVKGRALVSLRFNEVTVAKTPYRISTARIVRQAEATKGEDATKIGVGAGVGTAIGAIAGGKKGAAIGAGIGGGAGTGAVLATRGKEVTIPAGATLRTTVQETVGLLRRCTGSGVPVPGFRRSVLSTSGRRATGAPRAAPPVGTILRMAEIRHPSRSRFNTIVVHRRTSLPAML